MKSCILDVKWDLFFLPKLHVWTFVQDLHRSGKKMLSGEEFSGQYGHILLLYFYASCNKIQRKRYFSRAATQAINLVRRFWQQKCMLPPDFFFPLIWKEFSHFSIVQIKLKIFLGKGMFPTAKLISLSLNSNKRKALVGNFDFSSAWFIYPWDRPEQGILPAQDRLIKLFQVSQIFALCQPAPVARSLVIADLPTLRKNIHGLNASLITAKRQSSYGQKDINVILVSFSFIIFHTALESSSEGAGMYFSSYAWQRDHKTHSHMQSSTAILHPSSWHREARFLQGTKDLTLSHRDQDCVTTPRRLETSQSHLRALSEGRCPRTWIQTSHSLTSSEEGRQDSHHSLQKLCR